MPASASTSAGTPSAKRRNVCSTSHFIPRTTIPSRCPAPPARGRSISEQSTGITVRLTTNDAAMLVIVATAIGVNNRPSSPSSPNSGRNTSTTSTVAYRIECRTSPDAAAITSSTGRRSAATAFSRNLRHTFSTSTIASSTTIPIATANPPSVIEFTLTPATRNTSSVTANDSGIAVSVITVVLTFSRNRNSTTATMIAPSRIASRRFPTACPMKSPCRNSTSGCTPAGSVARISSSASSIAFVSRRVSAPGALSMLRITPIVPFTLASPRITPTPSRTAATSLTNTVCAPFFLTTVDPMSSSFTVKFRCLTMISRDPA